MTEPFNENRVADHDLQRVILTVIQAIERDRVLSTAKAIDGVRLALPDCLLTDTELARLINEAAMCLGMVPVFDPVKPGTNFGYGHPAHKPEPSASYRFEPGKSRCLPVDPKKRWSVTG